MVGGQYKVEGASQKNAVIQNPPASKISTSTEILRGEVTALLPYHFSAKQPYQRIIIIY